MIVTAPPRRELLWIFTASRPTIAFLFVNSQENRRRRGDALLPAMRSCRKRYSRWVAIESMHRT